MNCSGPTISLARVSVKNAHAYTLDTGIAKDRSLKNWPTDNAAAISGPDEALWGVPHRPWQVRVHVLLNVARSVHKCSFVLSIYRTVFRVPLANASVNERNHLEG